MACGWQNMLRNEQVGLACLLHSWKCQKPQGPALHLSSWLCDLGSPEGIRCSLRLELEEAGTQRVCGRTADRIERIQDDVRLGPADLHFLDRLILSQVTEIETEPMYDMN